ncbi:MAG: hypothetical protein GY847_16250 [Proteobacteria bacterium]|nr:hypothetical protein [Pseudomonadota bacterium]
MNKTRISIKVRQMEMLWSNPNVSSWVQLPSATRSKTIRLMAQLLLEAGREARHNVKEEKKLDE